MSRSDVAMIPFIFLLIYKRFLYQSGELIILINNVWKARQKFVEASV